MERRVYMGQTHPLLSRLGNVLLGLEELADVQGLAAPEVSVDAPVEGELEGPPVQASTRRRWSVSAWGATGGAAEGRGQRT